MVKNEMICSAAKKSNHCLTKCFHGIPHEKESGRDSCHLIEETCTCGVGIQKVFCRKLTKKEIAYYEKSK